MRRVWIEISFRVVMHQPYLSPSMRRVWIEISPIGGTINFFEVTLHAEGVD